MHGINVRFDCLGSRQGVAEACRFNLMDSLVALNGAFLVNAAILIVSAAAFHTRGQHNVAEIQDAYQLLSPTLGVTGASVLFAVALLASGQNSTLTGTLAGQIVMEGFLNIRLRPWLRRLITRAIAIIPAVIVTVILAIIGVLFTLIGSYLGERIQMGPPPKPAE